MKEINFKSKEAESYYLNKVKGISVQEIADLRKVSKRTIESELADFRNEVKDLPFDEVVKSFADISLSYSDAKLRNVVIDELSEGRYFFYDTKDDSLIYEGTIEGFYEEKKSIDKRFVSLLKERLKDTDVYNLDRYNLRVKRDFNTKYFSAEERILQLEREVQSLRDEIQTIRRILKDNYLK